MRRKQLTPLLFIVLAALGALAAVVASGTTPLLGLDLQGGVSVVLEPTEEVSDDALDQTVEIIRNRVDALGVAEPEITRQGDDVVVQLPGVENQQRALELVGDTAELRFRPVLRFLPGSIEDALENTTTTTAPADGGTTSTAVVDDTSTTEAPVEGQSAAGAAVPYQEDPAATTTVAPADPEATTTTTVPPTTGFELTPREEDLPDQPVVLAERDDDGEIIATYQLGPTAATGEIVADAAATIETGQWSVRLEIKGGEAIDSFNAIAGQCNSGAAACPTGRLAIVLDSTVVSAPSISQPSYDRDEIQITGEFNEGEAKDLALVLRYGSLPVNLEPQTVRTVSATLGEDSLRAGLIAGLVGVALVLLYLLVYYRALGLVVVLGLSIWAGLTYSMICWLGETQGLALSLAGVTGLVVSIGVTVDSYVVYFERLKDEVTAGRTLQSSTHRAFKRTWRTILAANVASLIGAALLYWLTVGPVRGFAFFLGLATLLDMVVAWFFIGPMVALLARSRLFTESPRFGVARGLAGRTGALTGTEAKAAERRRSIWTRLYHGETAIRFVPRLRRWAIASLLVIVIGLVSLFTRGLNLGIDFDGGVVWEVAAGELSVADAQEAVEAEGLEDVTVQTLEADGDVDLRVEAAATDADTSRAVTMLLAERTGTDPDDVSFTSVGPSWGDEISEKALRALVFFLIAITIYISFRFELRMAIPTVVALVHDVLVTVGVYSLFGFEVTPATVIAVLTILGFSIYDGIVVFDKVEENVGLVGSKEDVTYGEMVDRSLNEVLMRSLNTSITALLPVASLLLLGSFVLGATTLEEFGLALFVGLFAGAYSSIFIATPLHAVMKEREPRYRDIKARLATKRGTTRPTPAAAPAAPVPAASTAAEAEAPSTTTAVADRPAASSAPPAIPPRPRKKGRRR